MAKAAMGGLGSVAAVIDRTQGKWPFCVEVRSSQPVLGNTSRLAMIRRRMKG